MSEYKSNTSIDDAAALLRETGRVLVTTHGKPDGDALGSAVALGRCLERQRINVTTWLIPPVSAALREMPGFERTTLCGEGDELPEVDQVVIVDTGAWSQLEPMRRVLEPALERTLIIDHHLDGDVAASKRIINTGAGACAEIIADLVRAIEPEGDPLADSMIRDALFVGIASDTGWFRFSNTSPRTHRLAAELIARGGDHAAIYRRTEQNERPEKLKLMIRALDSLELLAEARIAVMCLRASDFAETGALIEETERFVDVPQVVATVQVVALLTEPPAKKGGEPIKLSFRSKPGAVNVADIAAQFGGGGHARAAGGRFKGPMDKALTRVRQALSEAVAGP